MFSRDREPTKVAQNFWRGVVEPKWIVLLFPYIVQSETRQDLNVASLGKKLVHGN